MDFSLNTWGNLPSLIALALTGWAALAAKNAAGQARDAAIEARDRLLTFDAISELSSAITTIQEITWEVVWNIVLDRYETSLCT